jgi:Tfp pilus assembly protein PilO
MSLPPQISKQVELLTTKFRSLDEKNLYYVFIIALIIIFALDYFILMRPQLNSLLKIGGNVATMTDDLKQAKDNISKLESYKQDVERLKTEYDIEQTKIRSKEEVSFIMEKISVLADKNHIKIDQILPRMEGQKEILDNKKLTYFSLPIEIEARASYHNFGEFINDLERADVYFKISDFSMAYVEGTKENTNKLTVQAIVYDQSKPEDKDKDKDKKKNKNKKKK